MIELASAELTLIIAAVGATLDSHFGLTNPEREARRDLIRRLQLELAETLR